MANPLQRVFLIVAGGLALALAAIWSSPATGERSLPGSEVATASSVALPTRPQARIVNHEAIAALDRLVASNFPAQVAHLDPETGELAAEPVPGVAASLATRERIPMRTDAGLTEVALPGGGAMVDLEDRFINVLVVTVPPGLREGGDAAGQDTTSALEKVGSR